MQPIGRRGIAEARGRERGERGEEAGQRLARTRIGNQQRVIAPVARLEHGALMVADAPAAPCKPVFDFRRNAGARHATTMHERRVGAEGLFGAGISPLPVPGGLGAIGLAVEGIVESIAHRVHIRFGIRCRSILRHHVRFGHALAQGQLVDAQ